MPIVIPKLRSRAPAQPGRVAAQSLDREHRLATPLDLGSRQAVGVCAVAARKVDEVQVGELARVVHHRDCRPTIRAEPGEAEGGLELRGPVRPPELIQEDRDRSASRLALDGSEPFGGPQSDQGVVVLEGSEQNGCEARVRRRWPLGGVAEDVDGLRPNPMIRIRYGPPEERDQDRSRAAGSVSMTGTVVDLGEGLGRTFDRGVQGSRVTSCSTRTRTSAG